VIHLMMLIESSKDNVTETSLLQKQEHVNTLKPRQRKEKKRKLQHARKFLKNSSCLEDTSQDSNTSMAELLLCHLLYTFLQTAQKFPKLITTYLRFR